jgi:hypothetical protein
MTLLTCKKRLTKIKTDPYLNPNLNQTLNPIPIPDPYPYPTSLTVEKVPVD